MIHDDAGRFSRKLCLLLVAGLVAACGEESPMVPAVVSPDGVWRVTQSGVSETTLRLAADGSFSRVRADLAGSSCSSSSGTWRADEGSLTLQITTVDNAPTSGSESYAFSIEGGQLALQGAGTPGDFSRAPSMVSCVDYGFGSWTGSLRADVDGVDIVFDVVSVRVSVDGGSIEIEGSYSAGADERELLLQIDGGPGPLDTGSFTVQNVPGATDTFYGLYHPDPGSPTFSGFDTTRLSPPGTFNLTAVAPERVAATFSFRANPRVEGEVGPGGATFAEIESGRVDLIYQ